MYVHTFSSSRSIHNVRNISHTVARIQLTNNSYLPAYSPHTPHMHPHTPHTPHTRPHMLTFLLSTHCTHSSHTHPHMLTLLLSTHCTHSSHAPSHAHTPPPLPQAVPGPGKYDIRSQFVHRQPHKDAAAEASLAPFGSSTKVCVPSVLACRTVPCRGFHH